MTKSFVDLKNRYYERVLISTVVAALVVAVFVYFWQKPGATIGTLAGELAGGFVGTLIAFITIRFFLKPPNELLASMSDLKSEMARLEKDVRLAFDDGRASVVPSGAIPQLLEKCRNGDSYAFVGNTGGHFSSVSLPALAATARRKHVDVFVQIINPDCESACERFSKLKSIGDATEVKCRLLSTLVLMQFYVDNFPKLKVHASLRDVNVTLRVDLGNDQAVITTEGDGEPAFLCVSDGLVYQRLSEQMLELVKITGRHIDVSRGAMSAATSLSQVSAVHVRPLFQKFGLTANAAEVDRVLELVRNPQNPYASRHGAVP